MSKVYATPGVYIEEKSAFPNSAVPVPTAVPAFIGYTEKAILNKKDITNVPTRIASFGEFLLYFGGGPQTTYTLIEEADPNKIYDLKPKANRFLLFNCIKMFFANGGSDCYIVSIGNYAQSINPDHFRGEGVDEATQEPKLIGLNALLKESEPTMVVVPDAVLLEQNDCYALQKDILLHCGVDMRSRFAVLDIYDGFKKRTPDDSDVVTSFREGIGSNHLQWGSVYYPWVNTTITSAESIGFTNIDTEAYPAFIKVLSKEVNDALKAKILDAKRAQAMLEAFELMKRYSPAILSVKDAKEAKEKADDAVEALAKAEGKEADDLKKAATPEAIETAKKELEIAKNKHSMAKRQVEIAVAVDLASKADAAKKALDDHLAKISDKKDELKKAQIAAAKPKVPGAKVIDIAAIEKVIEGFEKLLPGLEDTAEQAISAAEIKAEDIKTHHQTLLAVSPLYKSIMTSLREHINLLPPSAAMAGIYAMIDNTVGVFQSPANISMGTVVRPSVNLTNDEQEDLNLPLNGKAVNAIRTFPGKGVLVWGARTLDGNSQDWKYISVRRTVIFIEQSIKYATEPYVFAPNTATTWTNVKAMLTNFLNNVWQQGALAGATPEDAFSVSIGLGETMTPVDILDGVLRITVKLAVTRPAEFIVVTFEQQMQKS